VPLGPSFYPPRRSGPVTDLGGAFFCAFPRGISPSGHTPSQGHRVRDGSHPVSGVPALRQGGTRRETEHSSLYRGHRSSHGVSVGWAGTLVRLAAPGHVGVKGWLESLVLRS